MILNCCRTKFSKKKNRTFNTFSPQNPNDNPHSYIVVKLYYKQCLNRLYIECIIRELTGFERYFADHHPFVGEKQLQFEKPAGPVVKFYRNVSGLGHDGVRRVRVRHGFRKEVFASHTEIGFGMRKNLKKNPNSLNQIMVYGTNI